MRRIRRQSPTIVIAVLALVAAVTGAAVAHPVANKAVGKKKVKKIAKKQAKKYFDANIAEASVAHAASADNASKLGNLGPEQFLRSSRIQFGGPAATNTTTQKTLLSLSDLGIEVRTDGDVDLAAQIRLVNTTAAREYIYNYGV